MPDSVTTLLAVLLGGALSLAGVGMPLTNSG